MIILGRGKERKKKTEIAIAGAASHVPLASSMAGGAGCTSRTDGGVPPAAFPGTDADAARLTEKERVWWWVAARVTGRSNEYGSLAVVLSSVRKFGVSRNSSVFENSKKIMKFEKIRSKTYRTSRIPIEYRNSAGFND
jgi:hypothetical protein